MFQKTRDIKISCESYLDSIHVTYQKLIAVIHIICKVLVCVSSYVEHISRHQHVCDVFQNDSITRKLLIAQTANLFKKWKHIYKNESRSTIYKLVFLRANWFVTKSCEASCRSPSAFLMVYGQLVEKWLPQDFIQSVNHLFYRYYIVVLHYGWKACLETHLYHISYFEAQTVEPHV